MATHTFTDDGKVALDVNVVGGGASGPSEVEVTNFPATQPVSGPLTEAQFLSHVGGVNATPWNGTGGASTNGIIKGIYLQNQQIISLLEQIRDNTAPTP